MSFSSNKKKELTLQETFYNLCKDLIRYIDRKIIKKYISPNQAQVPKEKRIKEKKYNDNRWRYFYEDEETTKEEKIKDIFKDNSFLFNLQHLYNSLNVIVNNMEENKRNIELLNQRIELESQKLKLFGEINDELTKYSIENNTNLNNLNQDDLNKLLEKFQNNTILKNINRDMLQQFIISNANTNNNIMNNNSQNIVDNNNFNNSNINDNNLKLNENNDNINNGKNGNNGNTNQNINKIKINKSIPTLIQALESINKKKNDNNSNKKKVFRKNDILDSDSNDSSSEEENIEEEEKEFDEIKNKKEEKFKKIKFKKEDENKNIINRINKKTKRKNFKK